MEIEGLKKFYNFPLLSRSLKVYVRDNTTLNT